jgi:hypothetical protein
VPGATVVFSFLFLLATDLMIHFLFQGLASGIVICYCSKVYEHLTIPKLHSHVKSILFMFKSV